MKFVHRPALSAAVILGSAFASLATGRPSHADEPPAIPFRERATRPAVDAKSDQQPAAKDDSAVRSTLLEIDLLAGDALQGLDAQEWGRIFDELGQTVRVRSADVDEEPNVTETIRGTLRRVKIVGRIDRAGTVTFPGKSFKKSDGRSLKEWLAERETYGAQGSPEGAVNWGLNREQFTRVFTALSAPIEIDLLNKPLPDLVEQSGLPDDLPLRVHSSAQEIWRGAQETPRVLQEVRGLSLGTGLAVVLADHGLCLRPLRIPAGGIELVVQLRSEIDDPWPIGWEPKNGVARTQLFPELFRFQPIGFLERPMVETLDAAEAETGIPVVIDYWKATEREIDLATYVYGLPQRNTAWVLVLKSAMGNSQMQINYRIDEAGHPFLWVTPFERKSAKR